MINDPDRLSGELLQAVLCVLQDRGYLPKTPTGADMILGGAIRIALLHVLEGKTAEQAADAVKDPL